jgi:riboflavin kinase/FMN adenylyltransferase
VIQGLEGRIYLTTVERRVRLLAAQGMDLVIVHAFDDEVRMTRAADFVDRLCQALDLRELWGGNFSLGYRREGNASFLGELGQSRGFEVHEINSLVEWGGGPVSSSRIRQALANGDIAEVNGCLSRRFAVGGEVIRGDQRGRTIGFPTANLAVWERQLLPANGVYAAYARLGSERFMAATNVGVRPTVADVKLIVEAYLLDFERDIYGQELELEFVARIRDERKFPGLEALKTQIAADVEEVRQLLK